MLAQKKKNKQVVLHQTKIVHTLKDKLSERKIDNLWNRRGYFQTVHQIRIVTKYTRTAQFSRNKPY